MQSKNVGIHPSRIYVALQEKEIKSKKCGKYKDKSCRNYTNEQGDFDDESLQ